MKIILKDKNGVILHTAKKYCNEDININIESQEIEINPSTKEQIKEGLFNKLTVPGDTDLIPENIKKGVNIFGVDGGFDAVDTSDATATASDILKDKTAYVNGEKIVGTYKTQLTTDGPINIPSESGTVQIKINGKNKFDSDDWYSKLSKISSTSMKRITLDGKTYYAFMPNAIYSYQYMNGQFKENTQYTISCKARKATQNDLIESSGFMFWYTDGTYTFKLIKNTLEEYDYIFTSEKYKTISYIGLAYTNNNTQYVRLIQLEEGTTATEWTKFKDGQTYAFDIEDGDNFEISLKQEV